MEAMLALAIVEKLIIHGVAALPAITAALQKPDPTPEDIRALKITKDPEEYFDGRTQ